MPINNRHSTAFERRTLTVSLAVIVSIERLNFLDFDVYIVSLLVWTLSSKKFVSIQENTIAVLANLYGELSLRWPALFRIFTNEILDTLNGSSLVAPFVPRSPFPQSHRYDQIRYGIHRRGNPPTQASAPLPRSGTSSVVILQHRDHRTVCHRIQRIGRYQQLSAQSHVTSSRTDDRRVSRLSCFSAVLKHLTCTFSTLLDRSAISTLIGTLIEIVRTADVHVKAVCVVPRGDVSRAKGSVFSSRRRSRSFRTSSNIAR